MSQNILKHLAIIMDGNGRWATQKNLSRTKGHEEGAKVVREVTEFCAQEKIQYLTLYAFSTENWNRPKLEIEFLMKLLKKYLKNELSYYLKNNIRFQVIGDISKFSSDLQKTIQKTIQETSSCTGMTQVLALNYGSRDEITRAVKKLVENNLEINEQNIQNNLDTADIPDVDLLIRTSGEVRISNFLLWQCAYAEMFFTDTLWPDFRVSELKNIMTEYSKRTRRFGGI